MGYKRKRSTRKIYKAKRRKKPWRQQTSIQKGLGFSNGQIVKMRYVGEFFMNPGLGSVASHIFRANGLYDPDYTSSGHQPYGFDQWMTYYNQFTVLGSKCTARFLNYQGTSGNACMVGIQLKDTATVDNTNPNDIIEQGRSKWTLIQPFGGTRDQAMVTKGFSTKKYYQAYNSLDDIYRGSALADPTEQAYFHIIAGGFDPSSDPTGLRVHVVIDYVVKLNGPKPLVSS